MPFLFTTNHWHIFRTGCEDKRRGVFFGGREGRRRGREGEGKRRGGREGQINMKENGGGYRRVSQISYVFGSIVNIG